MSASLTRRRALAASTAAALGLGVAALPAAKAHAAVGRATSPEAVALRDELHRVAAAYRVAARKADEASERVEYPEPPEAVFCRPGDHWLLWRAPTLSWAEGHEGRFWWATHDTVEKLRGDAFRCRDGAPSPAAARRDEVVAAWDEWRAADRAAEDAAGYTAAMDRFDEAHHAYEASRARLVALRTADPDIVALKAQVVRELCRGDLARLDELIAHDREKHGQTREQAMALSIARDVLSLLGADLAGVSA